MIDNDHKGIANLLNLPVITPVRTPKVETQEDPLVSLSETLSRMKSLELPKNVLKKDEFGYTPAQNKEIEKQLTKDTSNSKGAFKRYVEQEKKLDKRIDDSKRYLKGYQENVKYIWSKDRQDFRDREGNKVRPEQVLAEQQQIDQKISGAKTLQHIEETKHIHQNQPVKKPHVVFDMGKNDYVDVNNPEKKEDFKFEKILPLDKKVPNIQEREMRKNESKPKNPHRRLI